MYGDISAAAVNAALTASIPFADSTAATAACIAGSSKLPLRLLLLLLLLLPLFSDAFFLAVAGSSVADISVEGILLLPVLLPRVCEMRGV